MTTTDEGIKTTTPEDLPPERPDIRVLADNLHGAVSEAEAALIAADAPIFQRGTGLVIPIKMEHAAANDRKTITPMLDTVDAVMLRDELSSVAVFKKYMKQADDFVAIPPPRDIAEILLRRARKWKFRPIAGVITTPTMRPDGSILIEEGYDPATQLYHIVDPNIDLRKLDIPEKPTRADALECLGVLQELLVEFPFKAEIDRSVALSGMISGVMTGAVQRKPLHGISAPESGTGKSYLCDLMAAFAIGDACPVIATGRTEQETESRLIGLLLRGLPIVSIDNVTGGALGSDLLNQMLERPVLEVRPLGTSNLVQIVKRPLFFATGNNFKLRSDLARKSTRAEMDAEHERPETRAFKFDPFQMVLDDRATYIAAVLVMVRAYLMSGEKVKLTPFASYAEYNRFVRAPLVWLGCEDPAKSIEKIREDDPDRSAMLALFAAWYAVFDDAMVSVATVVERCKPREGFTEDEYASSELRDALMEIASDRNGGISGRVLGYWLREHKDRRLAGYHLLAMPGRSNTQRWRVVRPDGDEATTRPEGHGGGNGGGGGSHEYYERRADIRAQRTRH